MRSSKREFLIVSLMLAVVALLAGALVWPGFGQDAAAQTKQTQTASVSPVAPAPVTVKKTLQPLPVATGAPVWTSAAQQNKLLRVELNWVFGGRAQRGWDIYTPLIARTLNTEAAADTGDFAQALARWQQGTGLQASGTLDSDTLYQLITAWQARRLKDHTTPSPEQLLTAPPTDFYAPERPAELRQVEKNTYAAYKRMVAAAAADPSLGLAQTATGELAPTEKFLKIVSAFRS
jgi:hypothetical protein